MKVTVLLLTVMFAATSFLTTGCKKKEESSITIDVDTKEVEETAKDMEKEAEKTMDEMKK